jgi:hypothetical protein
VTEQLAIDFTARARRNDPHTSRAAAERVSKFEGAHFKAILRALEQGDGTIYEIASRTAAPRLDHVQCARRLGELLAANIVERRGDTRPSPSGSPCAVWCIA